MADSAETGVYFPELSGKCFQKQGEKSEILTFFRGYIGGNY